MLIKIDINVGNYELPIFDHFFIFLSCIKHCRKQRKIAKGQALYIQTFKFVLLFIITMTLDTLKTLY